MFQLLLCIIYLSFISLGLPDSILGSAWPTMYQDFSVPLSYAGIISMIIALGTVISSLQSDWLTKKLGTGKVTVISVAMTAFALFGFSVSHSFWMVCFWAIPYGLGAGSVDASLNNYVALHYASRHMSWLHCMWGVGASAGPYIMSYALSGGSTWNMGYCYIAILQIILTIILIFSLPLWKGNSFKKSSDNCSQATPLKFFEIIQIPGVKQVMITFFCYCALEQTVGLWASSYLAIKIEIPAELAAKYASLFFVGITIGRAISGFLTIKLNDTKMVRLGQFMIIVGILLLIIPIGRISFMAGLIFIGLGCAPIYPCVIHSTPSYFGADKSQAIIGVQMASAYIGTCVMPPLFGMIANYVNISLLPGYLFIILILMIGMHEGLIHVSEKNKNFVQ